MANAVHALKIGVYDNPLLLFENHQDILNTLKMFKNAKHSLSVGHLTGADKQAFSALPRCGSAALHYLCMSLNPPNLFLNTQLWLEYYDLEPTSNAAEKINVCSNLEVHIRNHFTSYDSILDLVHMEMAKSNAQLIKDMTTNDPGQPNCST